MPEGYEREIGGFLTNDPVNFEFDPDTGLVSLIFLVSFDVPALGIVGGKRKVRVFLTPEASQSLLAALPTLQSLLEQGAKGPTKPDSAQ